MEVHMTSDSKQERGKVMPILMAMVGIINIVQFFYKFSFQIGDLLQGVGFILMAFSSYFVPFTYSNPFKRSLDNPKKSGLFLAVTFIGLLLAVTGMAFQSGWL